MSGRHMIEYAISDSAVVPEMTDKGFLPQLSRYEKRKIVSALSHDCDGSRR